MRGGVSLSFKVYLLDVFLLLLSVGSHLQISEGFSLRYRIDVLCPMSSIKSVKVLFQLNCTKTGFAVARRPF
ncbi:hypothetical protein HAX54_014402 [Datura stramonium]|uniref:Secreted protein n=1 Tax=Datura stramonium TaxID=4076 RepID=A0ABS8TP30_DATST|nr:hypothetical protein [Datura stramonium]